jgi:hypothetical protein
MSKYIQSNVLCSTLCAKWVAYSTPQVCRETSNTVSEFRKAYRKQHFGNNWTYGLKAVSSESKLNFIVWRCRLAMNSSADWIIFE